MAKQFSGLCLRILQPKALPSPNLADGPITVSVMVAILNWIIAETLAAAVADLKKRNKAFENEVNRRCSRWP